MLMGGSKFSKPKPFYSTSLSLPLGTDMLDFNQSVLEQSLGYVVKAITVVIILIIGYTAISIIKKALKKVFAKTDFDESLERFIYKAVKAILWIILILLVLENIGLDVGPMLAGLGIAGFVLGFALKDVLGNFASGIMILLYKPFRVGDYIDAGGVSGTVEEIGMSASKLKTPENIKITVPNSSIWGKAITNYSNLDQRRMEVVVTVDFKTNITKLKKLLLGIKDKRILADPAPALVFKGLEYGIKVSLRAWASKDDYWDVLSDLNEAVSKTLQKNKVKIIKPILTM